MASKKGKKKETKTRKQTTKKSTTKRKSNGIVLQLCKREEYIDAWVTMYNLDKKKWNDPMFDGINPMLNKKPLSTEVDNICVVAYDTKSKLEGSKLGKPVGIFSMVITERNGNTRIIGKQYVVDPEYQGKGIGKAMLLLLERELRKKKYEWYYIGCSKMSARILKGLGEEPYSSDEEADMYKFNVDLNRENWKKIYDENVPGKGFRVSLMKKEEVSNV